jgi:ATPases with chaperone activity, ATP-binding subunit
MWRKFTEQAKRALRTAQTEAAQRGENRVQPEHLLMGILKEENSGARRLLEEMQVDPDDLVRQTERLLVPGPGRDETPLRLDTRSSLVLELAQQEAQRFSAQFIGPEHLLLGLIAAGVGAAGAVLRSHGPTIEAARQALQRAPEAAAEASRAAAAEMPPPRPQSPPLGAGVSAAFQQSPKPPPAPSSLPAMSMGWKVARWTFALTFLVLAFLLLIVLMGA